jgi:hypothetical protein
MSLPRAAREAGMSLPTARKYFRGGRMPSEMKESRTWRTRENPFEDVWAEIEAVLREEPRLQAKTIFEELQAKHPGRFQDGQLRTLQRQIRQWRASDGPERETYFPQIHHPGDVGASDFTQMSSLNVTIAGQSFPHLLYHFVLTYSNWETASICFSESFESLAEGFQKAVWELGGVPRRHRTDCLSAAVKNLSPDRDFTARLYGLMQHYGVEPARTNPRSPHENGDCESLHGHLKTTIDQALLLRGSREFASRESYQRFLDEVLAKKNAGRSQRFAEERTAIRPLPASPIPFFHEIKTKVRKSSTIRIKHNTYSVPSRLIGEEVIVRVFAEHLELWYAGRCTERLPRLHGKNKHRINYRHIIESLVRKPGAFENYQWRDDLFPSVRFRMAFDELRECRPTRASREYLAILHLAALLSESGVESAIVGLLDTGQPIDAKAIKELVEQGQSPVDTPCDPSVPPPNFDLYDALLETNTEFDADDVTDDSVAVATVLAIGTDCCRMESPMEAFMEAEPATSPTARQCSFDTEGQDDGKEPGERTKTGTDGVAQRASPAHDSDGVRGVGAASPKRIAQLRAVSGGTSPSGMRRAASEPDHATPATIEDSAGEELGRIPADPTATESESAIEDAPRRRLPRPR